MIQRALLLVALFTASGASATTPPPGVSVEDDTRAREQFDVGRGLYREGRYLEAIAVWEEAYTLSPRPLFLHNIATAYERAGEPEDAIRYLEWYRVQAPASEWPTLDERIAALRDQLGGSPVVPDVPGPSVDPDPPQDFPPPETPPTRRYVAPVVLGGVAVAGLGVGAGFGASAASARRQAEASCAPDGGSRYCLDVAAPALRRNRSHAIVADVALAVGGSAAIAALVVALVDDDGWRVAPMWLGDGAGVALTLRAR